MCVHNTDNNQPVENYLLYYFVNKNFPAPVVDFEKQSVIKAKLQISWRQCFYKYFLTGITHISREQDNNHNHKNLKMF